MFYDQAILIQWLKEWDGRPARLFRFIRYGRDARATLSFNRGSVRAEDEAPTPARTEPRPTLLGALAARAEYRLPTNPRACI
jgi:hypothetical protein